MHSYFRIRVSTHGVILLWVITPCVDKPPVMRVFWRSSYFLVCLRYLHKCHLSPNTWIIMKDRQRILLDFQMPAENNSQWSRRDWETVNMDPSALHDFGFAECNHSFKGRSRQTSVHLLLHLEKTLSRLAGEDWRWHFGGMDMKMEVGWHGEKPRWTSVQSYGSIYFPF